MRETEVQTNETGTMRIVMDGQMSKMSPEQRVALASLNLEAKKRMQERVAFDAAKEEKMEARATEEQSKLKMETPMEEIDLPDPAYVPDARASQEDKCLPDPLEPQKREPTETGGPDVKAAVEAVEAMVDEEDVMIFEHLAKAVEENQGLTHSLRYTQDTLAQEFKRIFFDEIMALRNAGQKEYAHDSHSPFANFERGAKDMGIDRKQVLWCYAMKHKDGIAAALKGHTSQREDVRGRINDLIVYLLLLRGIFNEEMGNTGNFGLGDLER